MAASAAREPGTHELCSFLSANLQSYLGVVAVALSQKLFAGRHVMQVLGSFFCGLQVRVMVSSFVAFAFRCFAVVAASLAYAAADPLDALVGIFEHAPVSVQKPDSVAQATGAIVKNLGKRMPIPSAHGGALLDPELHHSRATCDRDFSQQCPSSFTPAGASKCTPSSGYMGPCAGVVQSFDGLSPSAKERWSDLCSAFWPCVECTRDFSSLCPSGWIPDGGTRCKPTATYMGPCTSSVNFAGFTRAMMMEWSSVCGAHWPCAA